MELLDSNQMFKSDIRPQLGSDAIRTQSRAKGLFCVGKTVGAVLLFEFGLLFTSDRFVFAIAKTI